MQSVCGGRWCVARASSDSSSSSSSRVVVHVAAEVRLRFGGGSWLAMSARTPQSGRDSAERAVSTAKTFASAANLARPLSAALVGLAQEISRLAGRGRLGAQSDIYLRFDNMFLGLAKSLRSRQHNAYQRHKISCTAAATQSILPSSALATALAPAHCESMRVHHRIGRRKQGGKEP